MYTGAAVFKQTDARMDSRDTLGTLSTDTGGRAFFDLGDLTEAFPKIQADTTGYYLVGYYLDASVKHDGSWHALRVKVNAPGIARALSRRLLRARAISSISKRATAISSSTTP